MTGQPADNCAVHPSIARLLDDAIQATANRPLNQRVRSLADLRRMLDVSHQTMGNWKVRGISTEGALRAEILFGIPASRLLHLVATTQEPSPHWMPPQRPDAGGNAVQGGQSHALRLLPEDSVLLISRESLMQPNELPPRFRIALEDAALAPELQPGDELYIDRNLPPEPGDLALLSNGAGQFLVRVLHQRMPGQWIAASINPSFAPLDMATDGLQVVGVSYGEVRRRRRSAV